MSKSKAWGVCQRSGMRYLLKDLVPDGRNPQLWVHPKFWEPEETRAIDTFTPEDRRVRNPKPEMGAPTVRIEYPLINNDTGLVMGAFNNIMSLGKVEPVIS